jgi:hypothetical protein
MTTPSEWYQSLIEDPIEAVIWLWHETQGYPEWLAKDVWSEMIVSAPGYSLEQENTLVNVFYQEDINAALA